MRSSVEVLETETLGLNSGNSGKWRGWKSYSISSLSRVSLGRESVRECGLTNIAALVFITVRSLQSALTFSTSLHISWAFVRNWSFPGASNYGLVDIMERCSFDATGLEPLDIVPIFEVNAFRLEMLTTEVVCVCVMSGLALLYIDDNDKCTIGHLENLQYELIH